MSMSSLKNEALDAAVTRFLSLRTAVKSRLPKKESEKQRAHLRDLENAVKPLPSVRPRRLTLPVPDDSVQPQTAENQGNREKSQTTNPQSRSVLFRKLPPELRLRVYSHFFTHERIPIKKDSRKRYVNWIGQNKGLLPLLLTCRRIYSEAIDLLYSQPEFFFDDLDTVCLFAVSILPHRRDLIQRIAVNWDCVCYWVPNLYVPPPYDAHTWFLVWDTLASMKSLQELRVRIWNGPTMDARTEITVFEPLRAVKGLDVFEIELPWLAEDEAHERVHADAPFRVKRVFRDYGPNS